MCEMCRAKCDYKGACAVCTSVYYCSVACHQKDTEHSKICHKFPTKTHDQPMYERTTTMANSIHEIAMDGLGRHVFEFMEQKKRSWVLRYTGDHSSADTPSSIHVDVLCLFTDMLKDIYAQRAMPDKTIRGRMESTLVPTSELTHHKQPVVVEKGMPHCRCWFGDAVYSDLFPRFRRKIVV